MTTRLQFILFFAFLGSVMFYMGYSDRQDEIAEEAHTKEIYAIAKNEAVREERDRQYQQLTAEADRLLKPSKRKDKK